MQHSLLYFYRLWVEFGFGDWVLSNQSLLLADKRSTAAPLYLHANFFSKDKKKNMLHVLDTPCLS